MAIHYIYTSNEWLYITQESTETSMKTLIAFACLVGISLGASINYGDCKWHYGGATSMQYCESGYVGVGACGNKGQSRCNGQAFGIKCCRIVNGCKLNDKSILSMTDININLL